MATAAVRVEGLVKRAKPKRRGKPRLVVMHGGKEVGGEEARSLVLSLSARFRDRQEQSLLERRVARLEHAPERQSIAKAMLAVEERLVKAFWTIARQPAKGASPGASSRNGLDYMPDRGDLSGYTDAAGGKWESIAPRPSVPCGKEIDAANEALDWLLFVDEARRKLLVVGATSKRGDAGRNINWPRIRQGMPELGGYTVRTLQRRYREALRMIVTELTISHNRV